jgi:vancomycin resistance protein VanJ
VRSPLLQAFATLFCLCYSLLCVSWLLLWWVAGDRWWWSFAANTLAPWLFVIGLPPAMVMAVLAGQWVARGSVLLVALIAAWMWGGLFLPAWPTAEATGDTLRIASVNTLTSNTHTDTLIAALAQTEADVLALQELSPRQAEAVTAALGEQYPYQALLPWPDPRGIGLWSRFPLEQITTFDTPPWDNWGQHVVLLVGQRRLHLLNVHLWPAARQPAAMPTTTRRRTAQVGELTAYLARIPTSEPFLLVGDFNMTPQNDTYQELTRVAVDSWHEVGWGFGFTWPNYAGENSIPAVFRIDYVWHSPSMYPHSMWVIDQPTGSDHHGVVAEFGVPAE